MRGPGPGGGRDPGLRYHELLLAGRAGLWRPLVGVPLVLGLTFVVLPLGLQIPVAALFLVAGRDLEESMARMLDLQDPTPAGLAFLNVVLASAIPVTFLAVWLLHGLRPGWLTSVRPRMRWGYLGVCLGLAVVALFATVTVAALLPTAAPDGTELSGEVNEWTSRTRDFVLVVVLLTPLQAAGEEYLFRGYLTQACGRIFAFAGPVAGTAVAVVAPAVLFALAHGLGQSLPVFVDRLAFGLAAGAAVVLTGGLEAGIAMHVLNNWLAFGAALAFGDLGSALNPTGGSWWMLPGTLVQSLVYLALVVAAARLSRLPNTAPPRVLERPPRLR